MKREIMVVLSGSEEAINQTYGNLHGTNLAPGVDSMQVLDFKDYLQNTIGLTFDLSKLQLPPVGAAKSAAKMDIAEMVGKVASNVQMLDMITTYLRHLKFNDAADALDSQFKRPNQGGLKR